MSGVNLMSKGSERRKHDRPTTSGSQRLEFSSSTSSDRLAASASLRRLSQLTAARSLEKQETLKTRSSSWRIASTSGSPRTTATVTLEALRKLSSNDSINEPIHVQSSQALDASHSSQCSVSSFEKDESESGSIFDDEDSSAQASECSSVRSNHPPAAIVRRQSSFGRSPSEVRAMRALQELGRRSETANSRKAWPQSRSISTSTRGRPPIGEPRQPSSRSVTPRRRNCSPSVSNDSVLIQLSQLMDGKGLNYVSPPAPSDRNKSEDKTGHRSTSKTSTSRVKQEQKAMRKDDEKQENEKYVESDGRVPLLLFLLLAIGVFVFFFTHSDMYPQQQMEAVFDVIERRYQYTQNEIQCYIQYTKERVERIVPKNLGGLLQRNVGSIYDRFNAGATSFSEKTTSLLENYSTSLTTFIQSQGIIMSLNPSTLSLADEEVQNNRVLEEIEVSSEASSSISTSRSSPQTIDTDDILDVTEEDTDPPLNEVSPARFWRSPVRKGAFLTSEQSKKASSDLSLACFLVDMDPQTNHFFGGFDVCCTPLMGGMETRIATPQVVMPVIANSVLQEDDDFFLKVPLAEMWRDMLRELRRRLRRKPRTGGAVVVRSHAGH